MDSLIEYLKTHRNCQYKLIEKKFLNSEIIQILNQYKLSFIELCYRLKNNIPLDKIIVCKYCKKPLQFIINKTYHYRYPDFCSLRCAGKYNQSLQTTKDKCKQTCLKKYGVDSFSKTADYKQKISKQYSTIRAKVKQTLMKHYNTDNYSKSKDYKGKIDSIQEKMKQSCMLKYGVPYYSQSEEYKLKRLEIQKKSENTTLSRYGVTNYSKTCEFKNKAKQTNLKRYGVDNYAKTKECKDKMKQTCIDKYGVDNYVKTAEYKEFFVSHKDQIVNKRLKTQKKNKSYNKSSFEEDVYTKLLTIFDKKDILRQYKSKLYPFACDFYIKSLDLYIEVNGHWTHGWYHGKCLGSFNKDNPEHIKLLNLWKDKNTKFYKNAIKVWTDLDVRKLETFKKNNLNYKIFWNIKEVEDWLQLRGGKI